ICRWRMWVTPNLMEAEMRALFVVLTALCIPTMAQAGDPCPIDFVFHDYGSPEWLDNAELLDGLESQFPLLGITYRNTRDNSGVESVDVFDGSSAAASELKKGDVIIKIEDEQVYDEADANKILDGAKVGTELYLEVV